MDYDTYLKRKLASVPMTGIAGYDKHRVDLFPFQEALTNWAIQRGRAAIFADTGLGKSRMQLAWADAITRHTGRKTLILAPLAVAQQTHDEGLAIGIETHNAKDGSEIEPHDAIVISNYERLHRFDPSMFGAVVLDESSCIKHHDTKTLRTLLDAFSQTPFKLCCTATPAPNDWTELGTHAEFLGICRRAEMLAEYFTHDGGETSIWRLKGHARHIFWRWVCQWGAMVRKPSDLGFDDDGYDLPPIIYHEHSVESSALDNGMLFPLEATTLQERRQARRNSIGNRVAECAARVNQSKDIWIIWCDLNAEADALTSAIPDAVEIRGTDDIDEKERKLDEFSHGKIRVLVTKPSIAGFGMNWQHCHNMAFVGVTDSFEAYYQSVRRVWRFGQTKDVHVHVFMSASEGSVVANLKRKEKDARIMAEQLGAETRMAVMESVIGSTRHVNQYNPATKIQIPTFL